MKAVSPGNFNQLAVFDKCAGDVLITVRKFLSLERIGQMACPSSFKSFLHQDPPRPVGRDDPDFGLSSTWLGAASRARHSAQALITSRSPVDVDAMRGAVLLDVEQGQMHHLMVLSYAAYVSMRFCNQLISFCIIPYQFKQLK